MKSSVFTGFFEIRQELMKVRISYMKTYLLQKRSEGLGCGLDVVGCGTRIDVVLGANSI